MGNSQSISIDKNSEGALEQVWEAYWFLPAGSRSLAVVRVVTGVLGLLLCATYGTDLSGWFEFFAVFPESASKGFLLCRSSAGVELSFPGAVRSRCHRVSAV